ncbi:photoreceptor cilium actin regulator-like [Anguilla anguilla]|uniref:photoreceptor cilium actin regulator-like n=1 Tax=Anguilla anguilla TaxID=7936 RepID=UPI0015AC09D8|nr:photoreceptor cilium actin regulator-like [Anguilla anguilla]
MGCSPSKGHNWNDAASPITDSGVLMRGPAEFDSNLQSNDKACSSSVSQIEIDDGERTSMIQKDASIVPQEGRRLSLAGVASEVGTVLAKVSTQEVEVNVVPQEKETQNLSIEENQGKTVGSRPRRSKGSRQSRQKYKDKQAFLSEQKVDFPEPMVKAHQAAYAYLNPSISKYEALLGLLDQAAHTQLSLRPMVAFMVLRYEEVSHSLEEMATEGEQMLKEHRDHLAWPCPMMDHCSTASAKPESHPPDLMQQLLQYSTERMRLVGDSVGGLGDSALEEASDYFFSLSELLDEKLKAKKVAEGRLSQVIVHIEAAAYRKSSPEDSALQSEDSGIGADNESLAGSEKPQHRRESCESAGTTGAKSRSHPCNTSSSGQQGKARTRQVGKVNASPSLNSLDSPYTGKDQTGTDYLRGSEDDEDENDDDEDEEEGEKKSRQRSNSSPPDPSQLTRHPATTRIENPQNVELTFKMKDAISGRIRFIPSQCSMMRSRRADGMGVGSPQWTEEDDWQARRPQTASATFNVARKNASAGRRQRSRSAESLRSQAEDPTLLQLERTQRDLSRRMERMSKGEAGVEAKGTAILNIGRGKPEEVRKLLHPQPPVSNRLRSSLDKNFNILPNHDRMGLRAQSSRHQRVEKEDKKEEKPKERVVGSGQLRASIQPSPPVLSKAECPTFHRGRNSVKRLIDTFSQKNDKQHQGPSNIHGSFRENRTCGIPTTVSTRNAVRIINGNNNNNSCSVDPRASNRPEDLDDDSLPPPPPEVLMDNSFECAPGLFVSESGDNMTSSGRSPVPQRNVVSQRLRASLPSVTEPSSHGGPRRSSLSLSPTCPVRQDAMVGYQSGDDGLQLEIDPKSEETATLYRQARKIIHLRHATDSPVKNLVDVGSTTASVSIGNNVSSEMKSTTQYPNIQPPTTPPVSRARMPPCTPSNWKLHNSPPFRCQPNPPPPEKLPTSPPGQQRHLNSLKLMQEETLGSTLDSCPLKANSPSPSPQVERWTRPSSPSQSLNDARSAFCHTLPSLSEPPTWTTSGSSALPQPWGMASYHRLPVSVRGPQPFVKLNQTDRHSSITLPTQQPEKPIATVNESCGNDPIISSKK